MFDNYNNILRRAEKFIGKIPCSNLSYHLEDLRQNEGYFLIKGQVSIYLANSFSPGKAPTPLPLPLPPTGPWRRRTKEGGIINHLRNSAWPLSHPYRNTGRSGESEIQREREVCMGTSFNI